MLRTKTMTVALAACGLAVAMSGCADNRLNGGYTGDEKQSMSYVNAPPVASSTNHADASQYIYRGGRDPVTGSAYLKN